MDQFVVTTKLWPSGASLDLGTDFNSVTVPASFNRHAANFVVSMDGEDTYQFLFWNTGRHLTSKRHVHWSFNAGGWGTWEATRWYGTPPAGNGGPPRVHADGFSLGGNAPLGPGTPIDGAASTFSAGAWPFMGNDHEIGTANGPATVVAKDPLSGLRFAGWLVLMWGGDDTDTFYEDDSGASMGSPDFFEHVSGPYSAARGASADLLAAYGNSAGSGINWKLIWEILFPKQKFPDIPDRGDPGPEDIIRIKIIQELLQQTRPIGSGAPDFEQILTAAPRMSQEELRRSIQSIQTTLELGKTTLTALQAQQKKTTR